MNLCLIFINLKLNFRFPTQQKRFGRYKINLSREEIKVSLCFRGIHGQQEKTHGEINQVIQIPSTISDQNLFRFLIKIYVEYFGAVFQDKEHCTRKDTELECIFIVCLQQGECFIKELLRTVGLPVVEGQQNILLSVLGNAQMLFSVFLFFFFFILLSQTYICQ